MRAGGAGGRFVAGCTAVALALVAAGCGLVGDDDDGTASSDYGQDAGLASLTIPEDLGSRGCGREAETDPTDLAADRPVARCAPEAPADAPLPAPVTLRVGVRARTEDVAPILLAQAFDEFAAENLTVEVEEYPDSWALYAALTAGEVDVVAGDLDAPFFDGVAAGNGSRLVLGGPVAARAHDTDTPQTGLWMRTDLAAEDDGWLALEHLGMPIALEGSIGDAAVLPVDNVLQQDDISLNELDVVTIGGEEAAQRLLSGELAGAWLTDPAWQEVPDSDLQIELVATLPVAESLSGVMMSARLVDPARDRAVGLAFARAVIRTINTYLPDDGYQDDDEVVEALVEATGQDRDAIVGTPAWVFDWELRSNTTKRVQGAIITLGGVAYERELPESRVVDRSLYQDVVGAP